MYVWLNPLDLPKSTFEELAANPLPDEKQRAARFRLEQHQIHYATSRGLLRRLLAGYLGTAAGSLVFDYDQYGKPRLIAPISALTFNVSHSYGWALFSFTLDTKIGVDIEKVRPDFATLEIARRFFSPDEVDILQSLPPTAQSDAFFKCWTRRWHFSKRTGKG